ncbi:MAG: J domain-containing protein [Chloroflexi bacterium]|nr:J domain-containing protein [Chloroflexota bacterium]
MPGRRTLDPYLVLGVARDATPLQVARAHRRLAKRHHPDLHEGALEAAERMRSINEAWAVLSNPVRRADYDRSHPSSATPAGGHWGPSRSPIQPAQPSSTRTWATWRATAAETRAAPRTLRQPGEVPSPRTRRPPRPEAPVPAFRDSGLAAILAASVIVLLLLGAIAVGRVTL